MLAIFQWKLDSRVLELGRRTLIMGIVNVTPDSFSDGGLYIDADKAVVRAEQLLDDGAAIIDVGGESTRPGAAEPVSEEEERRRVLPVIRDLKRRRPDAVVSVDTSKASVARAAVDLGAEVVNDDGGFRWDLKMAISLAELKVGAVLMHTRRRRRWRALSAITWCWIRDSVSEKALRRTIRCWRTSRNCSRWDSRCWRECRASHLSGEPWRALARIKIKIRTEMWRRPSAFTGRWPRKPR